MELSQLCSPAAIVQLQERYVVPTGLDLRLLALEKADVDEALAIRQAHAYGVPVFIDGQDASLIWAVPVHCNQVLLGGLLARLSEERIFADEDDDALVLDLPALADELWYYGIEQGWLNTALLDRHRDQYESERRRAASVHAAKRHAQRSMAHTYRDREQALIIAAQSGRQSDARALVNEVLVALYHASDDDPSVLRSLLLELCILLGRSAQDAGVPAARLAELRLQGVQELLQLTDEEALSAWLVREIEQILSAIAEYAQAEETELRRLVDQVLDENLDDPDLDRDRVAADLLISPRRLSDLLMNDQDRGFSDVLARRRISRAQELMRAGESSLLHVALAVGFKDPSYFTKVFRKYSDLTPRAWRKQYG